MSFGRSRMGGKRQETGAGGSQEGLAFWGCSCRIDEMGQHRQTLHRRYKCSSLQEMFFVPCLWLFAGLGHEPKHCVKCCSCFTNGNLPQPEGKIRMCPPQIHFYHSSFHTYTLQPIQHPEHHCQAFFQHSLVPLGLCIFLKSFLRVVIFCCSQWNPEWNETFW